jgi:hypothetical protein
MVGMFLGLNASKCGTHKVGLGGELVRQSCDDIVVVQLCNKLEAAYTSTFRVGFKHLMNITRYIGVMGWFLQPKT